MISTNTEYLLMALKAQQWEKCKGELRALVALAGSCPYGSSVGENWKELQNKVNDFVDFIDNYGLAE